MATGYTAIIEEGATFPEFVWRCARAMGPCVRMRDVGWEVPVPEKFEPGRSYLDACVREEVNLGRLLAMSDAEAEDGAREQYESLLAGWKERATRLVDEDDKFAAMRAKVEAWEPPTLEHAGLKQFMLDQINSGRGVPYTPPEPERETGEEWRARQIGYAEDHLNYCRKQHNEEVEYVEKANQWLAELRASVPQPGKAAQ